MFRAFKFYRHPNTLDIDIFIKKIQYRGPLYIKAKVDFVDRNHTGVFQSNATIKIMKKDWKVWQEV